jgi:hypothetical protein
MKSYKIEPILSICIPTFNRQTYLVELFSQLGKLDNETKLKIQICVSDNNSTDETDQLIKLWSRDLNLVTTKQQSNIGAARNFQEVTKLATAPWALLVGDDDLISASGLKNLINSLENTKTATWVFANVLNSDGTTLLEKFKPGNWTSNEFKRAIILSPLLNSMGFIGVHVIPRNSIDEFARLTTNEIYGWPHLALLIQGLKKNQLKLIQMPVVMRGGGRPDETQTWKSIDWLRLMMQKTKICCNSGEHGRIFPVALALKEYMKWHYARQTLHAISTGSKKSDLKIQATKMIASTNINEPVKSILRAYVSILISIPPAIPNLLRKINQKIIKRQDSQNVNLQTQETDGISRGL